MLRVLSWPFRMFWSFIGFLFLAIGKIISLILSLVLIFAGIIVTMTVVGAIVGIPLIIVGVLLFIRSLF